MTLRYLLPVFLALAGCSTTEPMWSRDGADQKQFYMETGQCEAQARSAGASGYNASAYEVTKIFQACMRGKGWYFNEVGFAGRDPMSFSKDDDICSRRTHRGPEWLECMERVGWTRK